MPLTTCEWPQGRPPPSDIHPMLPQMIKVSWQKLLPGSGRIGKGGERLRLCLVIPPLPARHCDSLTISLSLALALALALAYP